LAYPRRQQLRRQPHVPRHESGIIDDDVPAAPAQGVELTVAIAFELLNFGEKLWVRLTSIEQRDDMPALQGKLGHVDANEARATQDKNPQRPRRRCACCAFRPEPGRGHRHGGDELASVHLKRSLGCRLKVLREEARPGLGARFDLQGVAALEPIGARCGRTGAGFVHKSFPVRLHRSILSSITIEQHCARAPKTQGISVTDALRQAWQPGGQGYRSAMVPRRWSGLPRDQGLRTQSACRTRLGPLGRSPGKPYRLTGQDMDLASPEHRGRCIFAGNCVGIRLGPIDRPKLAPAHGLSAKEHRHAWGVMLVHPDDKAAGRSSIPR